MVMAIEKRHRTMVFVKKFKTSSFGIFVREPLGFEEKSSSEQWLSNRKYMSLTWFLSRTEGSDEHFKQKQKNPMLRSYRESSDTTTLQTPLDLKLEYLDLLLVNLIRSSP